MKIPVILSLLFLTSCVQPMDPEREECINHGQCLQGFLCGADFTCQPDVPCRTESDCPVGEYCSWDTTCHSRA